MPKKTSVSRAGSKAAGLKSKLRGGGCGGALLAAETSGAEPRAAWLRAGATPRLLARRSEEEEPTGAREHERLLCLV